MQIALKTSHNVILMHASLIQIPDIGFFVSPLPLHLAATTIIYGQSCGFTTLPYETGYEDVHSALYLTPALRWNWQRKDAAGGVHPITLELANRVFKKKPPVMNQPKTIPDFYPEEDWREDLVMNAQTDATLGHWPSKLFLPGPAWPDRHQISHTRGDSSNRSESASPVGQNAVPRRLSINGTSNGAGTSAGAGGSGAGAGGNGGNTNGNGSGASAGAGPSMPGAGTSYFKQEEIDLTSIFAQVPGYAYGAINVQPESEIQELFMQEEKDPMARANWSSRHGINLQDMGQQLQHMVTSRSIFIHAAGYLILFLFLFVLRVIHLPIFDNGLHSLVRERSRGPLHQSSFPLSILAPSQFFPFFLVFPRAVL